MVSNLFFLSVLRATEPGGDNFGIFLRLQFQVIMASNRGTLMAMFFLTPSENGFCSNSNFFSNFLDFFFTF